MRILKKSTAVTIQLGPFVDATDGFTLKTALNPGANDVELYKAGATSPVDVSSRSWTHRANGVYTIALLAGDVDTAGPLFISTQITGARPVAHEFVVVAASAYDALMSGTPIPSNLTQISGNATSAVNLTFTMLGVEQFTVQSGSTVNRIATDLTQSISSHWKDRTIVMFSGALKGQAARITGYNGATKELTVEGLTSAPSPGDTAVIV
jgi:hypothetical protein